MKGYCVFSKPPIYQIVQYHIQNTRCRVENSYLSAEMLSVYSTAPASDVSFINHDCYFENFPVLYFVFLISLFFFFFCPFKIEAPDDVGLRFVASKLKQLGIADLNVRYSSDNNDILILILITILPSFLNRSINIILY